MEEVEIEYLETIGAPESIRTKKQGRRANISDIVNEDLHPLRASYVKSDLSEKMVEVYCHRIIKFKYATKSEKYNAKRWLEKREFFGAKKVSKINSRLIRVYGDDYRDCNVRK